MLGIVNMLLAVVSAMLGILNVLLAVVFALLGTLDVLLALSCRELPSDNEGVGVTSIFHGVSGVNSATAVAERKLETQAVVPSGGAQPSWCIR